MRMTLESTNSFVTIDGCGAVAVVLCLLLGASPAYGQDGARYPVPGGPVFHVAQKAAASAAVAGLGRAIGLRPTVAALVAGPGLWAAAKGLELAKGHRLGRVDAAHDLGWHLIGALPVAIGGRRAWLAVGLLGVGVTLTRCSAAPVWGCS